MTLRSLPQKLSFSQRLFGRTRSSVLHLDLDLLGQAGVVLTQNVKDFVTAKVIRNGLAFGEELAQLGAGQNDAVFLAMGAGPHGSHAVTLGAVEGPVDLQGFAEQALAGIGRLRNLVEDFLSFEHAVEVASAG